MGIGLNAAVDPTFRNFQLAAHTGLELVPPEASAETVDGYKREFAAWVTANGLREIVEAYAVFLDSIYAVCLQILIATGKRNAPSAVRAAQSFERLGIAKKLRRLKSECSISTEPVVVEALVAVRNCLSHRRGLVSEADCNIPGALCLAWRGLDLAVEQPGVPDVPLRLPLEEPVLVENGGKVVARWAERRLEIPVGSLVRLQAKQLAEIAIWVIEEARSVHRNTLVFAQSVGVPVNITDRDDGS